MNERGISWSGVFLRIAFAVALVLLTFNPSGWSFWHWVTAPPPGITAGKALAGVALLIGWVICLRTAFVALGLIGLVLGFALLGALVWLLVDFGVIYAESTSAITWIALAALGVILGIGLAWALIRARATGQVEVQ
jgi:hypothetical protein